MTPNVSVIISHHLPENRKYLDLAIKGVLQSIEVDLELLVGTSYDIKDLPKDHRLKRITGDDLSNATKKIEAGISQMHPESKHILLLSDDVFISKTLLRNQLNILKQAKFILNPFSNGEVSTRFICNIDLSHEHDENKKLRLRPEIDYEDLIGFENSAAHAQGVAQIMMPVEWMSFYCTMMHKETYDLIGPLDPKLDFRHNDQDYCYRAGKLKIPTLINLAAFCIHFGSKTLPKCHTKEEMEEASDYFCKKIGGVKVLK